MHPPSHPQQRYQWSRQSGASLIEVVIAVLILAIGMLGVGAMQTVALRNSQSALERSQAVMLSYSALDLLRANPVAARIGSYNMPRSCGPLGGSTRADFERDAWLGDLTATLGEAACGRIACIDTRCQVEVVWDDARATGGESEHSIITVARL